MSDSLVTNRSYDTSSEENYRNMVNSNRHSRYPAGQDEESAKELRKIFPLPVLRHGHREEPANVMPQQYQNQVDTTILVPDDFTYVSELTTPEESYPNEIPTTKSLTSQNLRALESGLHTLPQHPPNQAPKAFPYQKREEDDDDDLDDVDDLQANPEDFSYDGEDPKPANGKLMCLVALFVLLVVAAAVAIGVGVAVSQNSDSNALEGVPTSPPIDGGSPTAAPTSGTAPIAPTATNPPAPTATSPTTVETESPVDVPTEAVTPAPTEAPVIVVPDPTPAPTDAEGTPQPTPATTPAPTETATEPNTPATTPAPTEGVSPTGGCVDQLTTLETCYPLGVPITVTFSVCEPDPDGLDWVGVYRDDGTLEASNLGEPRYWESSCVTSECQQEPYSDELPLDVTDLSAGTYKIFLVRDDSDSAPYSAFATGNSFQVSSSC
jgi:hypothetical protein